MNYTIDEKATIRLQVAIDSLAEKIKTFREVGSYLSLAELEDHLAELIRVNLAIEELRHNYWSDFYSDLRRGCK